MVAASSATDGGEIASSSVVPTLEQRLEQHGLELEPLLDRPWLEGEGSIENEMTARRSSRASALSVLRRRAATAWSRARHRPVPRARSGA